MSEFHTTIAYLDNTKIFYDRECITEVRPWGCEGLRVTMIPHGSRNTSDWSMEGIDLHRCFF